MLIQQLRFDKPQASISIQGLARKQPSKVDDYIIGNYEVVGDSIHLSLV